MRALFILMAVMLGTIPASAGNVTVDGGDRSAIREVIMSQIDAFKRDDGAAAFALASPGIRGRFGTPDNFMEMVRAGYQAVYRPRSTTFLEIVALGDRQVQKVLVVGPDGKAVIAMYPMQRQRDGSWRTDGCMLVDLDTDAI